MLPLAFSSCYQAWFKKHRRIGSLMEQDCHSVTRGNKRGPPPNSTRREWTRYIESHWKQWLSIFYAVVFKLSGYWDAADDWKVSITLYMWDFGKYFPTSDTIINCLKRQMSEVSIRVLKCTAILCLQVHWLPYVQKVLRKTYNCCTKTGKQTSN